MVLDLISLAIAFFLAYWLKFGDFSLSYGPEGVWIRYLILVLGLNVVVTLFVNPYSGILRRPFYMEIIRALQLTIYNLLLAALVFYVFQIGIAYSREMSFYMYGLYFVISLLLKFLWKKLLVSGKIVVKTTKQIPLFVIGNAANIAKTIQNVRAGDFQLYEVKGVHLVDDAVCTSVQPEGMDPLPVIGGDYISYILNRNIQEVLVAVTPSFVEEGALERLHENGVGLNVAVENAVGFLPEEQSIQNMGVYRTLSVGYFNFTPGQMAYLGIKRVMDFLFGFLGIVLLVPISALVKIAYLATGDKTSIFYSQVRVGQDGEPIRIIKFRTMVPNADEQLQELLKDPEYRKEWDEYQKLSNDPRITKVGRFLRRTSLDEFPQMINVMVGDMSLVGPRPLVAGELESHDGLKLYQRVKPGITGWWGCNGRSNIDYRERLELEYYYVKHCSLYLDMLCIFRTLLAVVKRDGAQ
jgi:undecaprenyl-phosphate galactose phosphotransferase